LIEGEQFDDEEGEFELIASGQDAGDDKFD
jgi:hypothetical protein